MQFLRDSADIFKENRFLGHFDKNLVPDDIKASMAFLVISNSSGYCSLRTVMV